MIYLDSLSPLDKLNTTIFRFYIELEQNELKSQMGVDYSSEVSLITKINFPHYQLLVPRQTNLSDCGVFQQEYVEKFQENPSFVQKDIDVSVNKLDWFPKKLIEEKRKAMIRQIQDIKEEISVSKAQVDLRSNKKIQEEEMGEIKEKDVLDKEFDSINHKEFEEYMQQGFSKKVQHMSKKKIESHKAKFFYSETQKIGYLTNTITNAIGGFSTGT